MGPTLTVRWPSCHSVTPYGNVRSRASLWGPPATAGSMSRAAVSVLETPALATDLTGRIASILCFRGFLSYDKKHDFYYLFFFCNKKLQIMYTVLCFCFNKNVVV